jgi:hypothetical protein
MIALRDLLARMQSQATGCVAVLRIDLRDGSVVDACPEGTAIDSFGDGAAAVAVGRIMRDLAAPEHAILPRLPAMSGAGMPQEVILLSDDHTYVCGRLVDAPHHAVAAICRGTQNLGLIVSLLHHPIEHPTGAAIDAEAGA